MVVMWGKAFVVLEFFLVIMGILFVSLIAHELTHLVGSSPPRGICLGFCGSGVGRASFSVLGYATAGAFNPLFAGEFFPMLVMYVVVFVLFFVFLVLRHRALGNMFK